jgi:hypothetical protein
VCWVSSESSSSSSSFVILLSCKASIFSLKDWWRVTST